jgi:glucose-1-phosphate thymidylyltransferase
METAKALILTGHEEDRAPWPIAPHGHRHLFPIANRPVLFHSLEALGGAGMREAAILVNRQTADATRRAVGDGSRWGLTVRYREWEPSQGLAGALAAAEGFLSGQPLLVQLGDALMRECIDAHIAAFTREHLDALALRFERDGTRSERNPAPGYLLSERAIAILLGGAQQAANPVAGVRAGGGRVRVKRVEGLLPCDGDKQTLLEGNCRMLEGLQSSVPLDCIDDATTIQGSVVVHPTAQVRASLLRGPLIIGPGAHVADAYVGPYTSIGPDAVIEGSQIEYSIVLEAAEIRFLGTRLESSVVGRRARIVRRFELPGTMSVTVGERAELVLR